MHRACSQSWSAACTWAARTPRYCPSTRVWRAPRCGRRWSSASTASFLSSWACSFRLILSGIHNLSAGQLARYGATFAILVIALRIIWVYPGAAIAYWIRFHLLHQEERPPSNKQIFIVAWTGMRGVLALAAAISLPTVLQDGSPFPQRNFIIFLTFCVIFATLVLQGLTLPAVIRKLGLSAGGDLNMEEQQARLLILNTVLEYLKDLRDKTKPEHAAIYEDMIRHYRTRATLIEAGGEELKPEQESPWPAMNAILPRNCAHWSARRR